LNSIVNGKIGNFYIAIIYYILIAYFYF